MRARQARAGGEGGRIAGSLLALLAVDLFVIQVHVFSALKLACAARGLPGTLASLLSVLRETARIDLLGPLVALGALLLGLVVVESRRRAVSSLLLDTLERRHGAVLATLLVVIVGARYYFDLGYPHQYDAKSHLGRTGVVSSLLAEGETPDWTFSLHGGFALLRISGPLILIVASVLSLAVGSIAWGVKLTLFGAHVGGAMATFHLIRLLGGSRRAAFLGAVGGSICFQHTSGVVLAGRLPVAFLYLLFPLILIDAVRLSRRLSLAAGLRFGLWSALLVLAHPGLAPYGILAASLFAFVLACGRRPVTIGLRDAFLGLVPAGIACVLLSAALVVPALLEREHMHIASMYPSATGFELDPFPDGAQLLRLVRWNLLWSGTSVAYVGVSLLLLFAVAVLRRGGAASLRWALGLGALFLVILTGGSYLQSRGVHFLVVVVAVGAGLAVDRLGPRWFVPALLLVLVDLGPTTFQSPFRPDLEYDVAYARRMAERADGGRVLRVSLRDGTYATSVWAPVYDSGLTVPTGPFREASSRELYPWVIDLVERVQDDLNERGGLSEASRLGLRCLGCEWLAVEDGSKPVLPEIAPAGLRAEPALPALAVESSSTAVAVLERSDVDALRALEKPSWPDALAAASPRLRDPAASGVAVVSADRGQKRIALEVETARDGVLALSLSRMPGLVLLVDGVETEMAEGPFGLIGVRLGAGRHEVVVAYRAPGYALVSRWVSLATLAVVLAGLLLSFLRRRGGKR
jgi:hypothetical protein